MKSDLALPRTSPEAAGISSAVLLKTLKAFNELDSLNSLMVVRHGKVCFECWWEPYRAEDPHILFSLSKSFVSIAIGIAESEGLLGVDDRLMSFFPEYENAVTDEKMRQVRLRHLLTMSSGHSSCARPSMLSAPDGDWVLGFLSSALDFAPGERFVYNSAATYILAAVLRKVAGQNVREYLLPRLFTPLGITPGMWECCPRGTNTGGWGLYLKTEDIAKVGLLILNHGRDALSGAPLIPEKYLDLATSKQIDNSMNELPDWKQGYGFQFWRSQHGFRGDGASGQLMVVLPEEDMVVAVTAGVDNMQQALTVLWEELVPGVSSAPLPEDPAAQAELLDAASRLAIPLAAGDLTKRVPPHAWKFQPNRAGITAARLVCDKTVCQLCFQSRHGLEILTAGFGFNYQGVLQLNDELPRRVAASAAWQDDGRLQIQICCPDASFRDVITVDLNSHEHPLTGSCRFSTFRYGFLPELTAI